MVLENSGYETKDTISRPKIIKQCLQFARVKGESITF
jgi:hypothetical protein